MIPVTAIVITKDEGENIAHCLLPLVGTFKRVVVVDSGSRDDTMQTAKSMGAEFVPYAWNGRYPKKRQWCLEQVYSAEPWVFFIDADEVISPALILEMQLLFARGAQAQGYFVRARPVWMNRRLRFGMARSSLRLFRRDRFHYPVVNDLDIAGMGEIEGRYEPIPFDTDVKIGRLDAPVVHHNRKGRGEWMRRHQRYAGWEAAMIARNAFPFDPVAWREEVKIHTRATFLRPFLVFLYSYVIRLGFLDGVAGYDYAATQAAYARDVLRRLRAGS